MFGAPSKIFDTMEMEYLLCRMVTPLGLQASDNDMFKGAVFGRDSLLTLLFLLETGRDYSWISDLVLTSLARMRGLHTSAEREEEPGKFAHELRVRSVPGMNTEIYEWLKKTFGEYSEGVVLIWPTVDATPLALIAAQEHAKRWGRDLLAKEIGHLDPRTPVQTLHDILRNGLDWVSEKIEQSNVGLLEYARSNLSGHRFHVLEDGRTSYRHEDGKFPNLVDPIAYLTSQGQAYDALLAGAELFPDDEQVPRWQDLAHQVRKSTFKHFWLEDRNTFASALDRDPATKAIRPVKTLSTVQMSILDSTIFDGLAPDERRHYVQGVLRSFFTSEFLTEAGPRSLAMKYDSLTPYYAYQGSRVTWPALTHRSARGCRRQGYRALAADLDARMVNAIQTTGEMRELLYVSPSGKVVYDPAGNYLEPGAAEIAATNIGQATQTWTIAAMLSAKHWLTQKHEPTSWEQGLLGETARPLSDLEELRKHFENRYRVRINCELGKELEKETVNRLHAQTRH